MNMLNRAFCEVMMDGDANADLHLPIPTYNIHKNFDWENANWTCVWQMTGRYGIPYFANFINSDMNPEVPVDVLPADARRAGTSPASDQTGRRAVRAPTPKLARSAW
jgi:anaerobic ribonucleoside-triphosphate reductase